MRPLDLLREVLFILQGRCWMCSLSPHHMSESVPDYFPELSKVEPIVRKWVGVPAPSVWVCQKLGGGFYGSPMIGKRQFGS